MISISRFFPFLRILGLLIILSFLLPAIKIANFGMKPDLLLILPALLVLGSEKLVSQHPLMKRFKYLFVLIFLSMLISDSVGNSIYEGQSLSIWFPTEFVQIFSRLSVFFVFMCLGYYQIFRYSSFTKVATFTFLTGMVWGILQSLNISFVSNISHVYALTETQLYGFQSTNFRGFGTAGNIIAWGGISSFCFYYFLFVEPSKTMKTIGCLAAVTNVFLSASRGAIISLILSLIIILFIKNVILERRSLGLLKWMLSVIASIAFIWFGLIYFMPERFELLEMRFLKTEEALTESGRGAQRELFVSLMNQDPLNYVFGMGKPVVDNIGYLEMEPLFLLVCYGFIGFFLHYYLAFAIIRTSLKLRLFSANIVLFILATSISFLIFSITFFFFREAYSGLPFWWVSGYFIGYLEHKKKLSL